MINRDEVLIKRAEKVSEILAKEAAVEDYDGTEYVVFRNNSNVMDVFLVDDWQVKQLEPEDWPDYLLDEAELV